MARLAVLTSVPQALATLAARLQQEQPRWRVQLRLDRGHAADAPGEVTVDRLDFIADKKRKDTRHTWPPGYNQLVQRPADRYYDIYPNSCSTMLSLRDEINKVASSVVEPWPQMLPPFPTLQERGTVILGPTKYRS